MPKNTFTQFSENLLNQKGQHKSQIGAGNSFRIFYPAIVRNTNDKSSFNRIQAEIVNIDQSGKITPGKDRDIPIDKLPVCIPLLTEFFHGRPKVGECVIVMSENPSDMTSPRFWIGPIITSQIKLPFQPYEESISIFNTATFKNNTIFDGATLQNQIKQASVLPSPLEIALQGREDADIVFRPREVELRAGKFNLNSTKDLNTINPCRLQLRQVDYNPNLTGVKAADQKISLNFRPYSQANLYATNFNFISSEGKFRSFDKNNEENTTNPRLLDFGDIATKLHPAVFGDELMKLLKLILQYLLFHVHVPQSTPLVNNIHTQLTPYLQSGKMQDLVSNVMRIC